MIKKNIAKVIELLEKDYQEVSCTLNYKVPLELLISTMLSAQCTDVRVNIVTPALFEKYKTPYDFMNADIKDLENLIRSTGFFRNKSENIKKCCTVIYLEFNNKIPDNMKDLVKLPGVGRKTANVFLGEIHHTPGIIVDTHAKRLSNRIGLTKESDPVKIERDLMKKIPKEKWTDFSHRLVNHGRAVCNARNPKCEICSLNELCEYYKGKR